MTASPSDGVVKSLLKRNMTQPVSVMSKNNAQNMYDLKAGTAAAEVARMTALLS